jgi:preprotein translocase subunit Sss1
MLARVVVLAVVGIVGFIASVIAFVRSTSTS